MRSDMEAEQAKFEGWALIELYGHAREAGYVTTAYFGSAAMFRVDVPDIEARQETADRPRWFDGRLCPVGTVLEAAPIPGRTRYIGPGAIYAMNPASEEAVRHAVASMVAREVKIISMPPQPAFELDMPAEECENCEGIFPAASLKVSADDVKLCPRCFEMNQNEAA